MGGAGRAGPDFAQDGKGRKKLLFWESNAKSLKSHQRKFTGNFFDKETQLDALKSSLRCALGQPREPHRQQLNISASDNQSIYSKLYNCRCW